MQTKILLADDHEMIRAGLRSLIAAIDDMVVVGEASNGRDAVRLAAQLTPDVIVMDMRMPDLNGLEATRQIMSGSPGAKIVALSADSDQRLASDALRAGAKGYVLKEACFDELAAAIRTVISGKVHVSPRIAGAMRDGGSNGADGKASNGMALTAREREVLQLMAEGKTTKGIAMALSVSIKTIETHRRNLMEKLKIDSVAELTKYAIREGLTSLDL
jgi:DNA-binding NarL/FixJ family response regulator